ncbi:hypothetical protein MICA_1692 [Micavibrio aeruginosavorus ARL-13]|uniref:Uncharacterized protein n=1 Tax=Micavibrio aeruginosavorus (strain ARL-13) TaxID=856793 RepID=G2KRP7_MICAA|nr:hypothetical protein MICA_1692 [Micavibrio aeruginosavorus ARL-13]
MVGPGLQRKSRSFSILSSDCNCTAFVLFVKRKREQNKNI